MASTIKKAKKWFKPMFEFEEGVPKKKKTIENVVPEITQSNEIALPPSKNNTQINISDKNWMRNFEPRVVEDLAIHTKKIQEIEEWLNIISDKNCSDILLLTGPVGCGKTTTIYTLAAKNNIKITEWITPVDIEIPSEYGDYEYKEKQTVRFLDFILKAANFTSLLDNNNRKLVLVEDFPNTFMRSPSEFAEVLQQYKQRAKSPLVFICSESYTDSKNVAAHLFTPSLKEQFQIHHIVCNAVSATGLRSALKRVADIISKKYNEIYNIPTADLIECVVNTSTGDVRSAVLNLHFACLKGSTHNLERSIVIEKEQKSKTRKKKSTSGKFSSLGKDQTVSILHGVGRVLNPKVVTADNGCQKLSHSPEEIIEQFLCQPTSFVNFLEENYLGHFSCAAHAARAAAALSAADLLLAEWTVCMV